MHIVVMGCGRVGAQLARTLDDQGHSVAVLDQDKAAFAKLGKNFGGRKIVGIGFDRDRLVEAGIENAHGFAAVSSGDNSNILAARVARETFGLDNVVARIYDPRRAEVYERLGIPTVASVSWQAERIMRRIMPADEVEEWRSPEGGVSLLEISLPDGWVGERVTRFERDTGARVAYVVRFGQALLPGDQTVLQADDGVRVLVTEGTRAASLQAVEDGPEGAR